MDKKRNYYEDVQLLSSGATIFWMGALALSLAIFPFITKNYYLYVANFMAINVIVVVGLNLLVGYTGQISLGHAGFFAIGAYGTIVLMTNVHFPFLLALPCAGFITALFGFLLGLPALRLEGPYLAIATLGFGITATQIIGKVKIFGERQGLHAPELTIDKDGYLTITDRKKDIIVTAGGKNITPQYIENKLKASFYINDAVVIGDRRKFISCLIILDEDTVVKFAQDKKIQFSTYKDLTEHEQINSLIESEIKTVNDTLARVEKIKKFTILPKKLYEEDGEVTPTMKVKRKFINEAFSDLIEAMY